MSCYQKSKTTDDQSSDYEEINVTEEFSFSGKTKKSTDLYTLDCKTLVESIPFDIFNLFTITINVFSCENVYLLPCEHTWIKTNVILKPYLPITSTFTFHGVVNGLAIKTSNQTLIPLKEEVLKVRVQNFNQEVQSIPTGMPLGQIVIKSKNYSEL